MDELRADDPRWIGGYRLLGRLGAGGMGRVYLGRSPRGRTVAVKLVRTELAQQDEFRSRFRREVRAARRVGGTWTAPVLDADTEADVPWVATGYVAGPSLQQVVGTGYGPLPEASVLVLASGLAYALADIHAAGLVHRDLKPSNVMITIDGPRVIDFGIARALETVADDGLVTYTGAMVGSPAFMSPEQVRGDRVTPACDVFCLGSVLAYAATGLQPFGAGTSGVHAQMFRIAQEPPDLDAVPDALRELVAACLVKNPLERPDLPQVRERIAAARRAVGLSSVPGSLPGPGQGPARGGTGTAAAPTPAENAENADSADSSAGPADPAGPAGPIPAARTALGEPWLPAAIVAQLGRQAVRLLELEAAETGSLPVVTPADAAAAAAATPTLAARPALPAARTPTAPPPAPRPAAAGWQQGPGGPQPSPGSPGPGRVPVPPPTWRAQAPPPGPAPVPAQAWTAPAPAPTAPAQYRPAPAALPGYPGPGAPGGPAAPPSGPGPARRGGLWALVGALALIAAGTTAYIAVREHRGGADPEPGPTATRAPRTTAPTATATATDPTVPAGLVGTWKATFDGGVTPGTNTRILTVHRDGGVTLTGDGPSYSCAWSMRVTATDPEVALSPSAVTRARPTTSCLPGDASTLVLLDGTHLRRGNADPGTAPLTYEKVG